jgi:hypothetical protein
MTRKRSKKALWEMNTEELARETAEFNEEFTINKFVEPPPGARARWEKAKRKAARPADGARMREISIRVAEDLLARSDALAEDLGISRSHLIARGLKAVLAAEGRL